MKLSNVLVATDFSAISEVALGVAVDIAETSRARLHIVHVVPPVTDVGDAAARLDQLKGRVDPRVPVETALLSGRAARQIAMRGKRVDLIVAGTHGRTGLSRASWEVWPTLFCVPRHALCSPSHRPRSSRNPNKKKRRKSRKWGAIAASSAAVRRMTWRAKDAARASEPRLSHRSCGPNLPDTAVCPCERRRGATKGPRRVRPTR